MRCSWRHHSSRKLHRQRTRWCTLTDIRISKSTWQESCAAITKTLRLKVKKRICEWNVFVTFSLVICLVLKFLHQWHFYIIAAFFLMIFFIKMALLHWWHFIRTNTLSLVRLYKDDVFSLVTRLHNDNIVQMVIQCHKHFQKWNVFPGVLFTDYMFRREYN